MPARVLLLATIAALLLSQAGAAAPRARVKLALIPLPKAVIGPAVSVFKLSHASGTVSNATAASHSPDGTEATFKKLGRVGGFALEWGNAFTGAAGITDVRTAIDRYKTPAGARRGLAFWQMEDSKLGALDQPGFAVTNLPVGVPAVGKKHFAYLTSYGASNIAPVSGLDEKFVEGRYVLDVIVTAGSASAAEALAPKLAKKLDARLRLALEGRLHAKPAKLPPRQKLGPPGGGPALSVLALRRSDLVGRVSVQKGYVADPAADSDYSVVMAPAGPFDFLDQEIEWYPSANEASFFADFENASALAQAHTTPLDLSSLGHGAQGSVTQGSSIGAGFVVFSSGKLAEFILMGVTGSIGATGVTNVAQAAANRLNAGLGG